MFPSAQVRCLQKGGFSPGKVLVNGVKIIADGLVCFRKAGIKLHCHFVRTQRVLQRMGAFPISKLDEIAPALP